MNNETKGVGIPCGHNPVVLGSVVDEDKPILGEERILFYGDIMFGPLIKIRRFYEYESLSLKKLWNDYNDQITDGANLYLVVTNALNGTIYACGHSKRGEWTVFAKTAGYA